MRPFFPLAVVLCAAPAWAQNAVSVHVVDEAGASIKGAQVQLWIFRDVPDITTKVTDATGNAQFALPAAPDGKPSGGRILVGAKGYVFNQGLAQSGKLEIRLQRGTSWKGRVVDEDGQPLAGATVSLRGAVKGRDFSSYMLLSEYSDADPLVALYSAQSKADGTFVINDVPKDQELLFRAKRPGFTVVRGQNGTANAEKEIKLSRAGSLRGRVLDVAGKPMPNVRLYASNRGEGGNGATSDANGAFTIDNLGSGLYSLSAMVPRGAAYILTPPAKVRVEVGKTSEVGVWRAQTGVLIRGVVRDNNQKPISGASLAAQSAQDITNNDDSAWATSDAQGRFALRVLPGRYTVRCAGAPLGFLRIQDKKTVLIDAKNAPAIGFVLPTAPHIRGITVDEKGKPMAAELTIGDMMGQAVHSDATGKWEYVPNSNEDLGFGGGSNEKGYFQVVSPKRVDWGTKNPIVITMRYRPWVTLAGRAVTSEGEPIEGVRVEGSFLVPIDDRISFRNSNNATSDKDGRFVLEKLRDSREPDVRGTDISVSGSKAGYEFQSGGVVSHKGNETRVSDLVFAALGGKIEGTTEPGALVVADGREVRADAQGRFSLTGLTKGGKTVFAAKGERFGSASGTGALRIELQPLTSQKQDQELAKQMWADIVGDTAPKEADNNKPGLQEWLTPPRFEEAMKEALAAGDTDKIAEVAERWKTGDSLEVLREGLERITAPDRRGDSWLKAALATNDPGLMKRALEITEAVFKGPTTSALWREPQLYQSAVLRERLNGAEDGQLALQRALAYTLQNHPEKSRIEGAMQTQVGRNQAFSDNAALVAAGSPTLLHAALDAIDEGSGFAVMARANAIPVVAKTHGVEAALPLLEELRTMPAPTLDLETRYTVFDTNWAYGQAVHDVMPLLGAKSPAQALELAKKVVGDEQRARALASAARFQTPEVAAPLYREAVEKIGTEDAPHIAAKVWALDHKLGMELFSLARQQAEDALKSQFYGRNPWIPFAFYLAPADPTTARLILEREWGRSRHGKKEESDLSPIVLAMAPVDGRRAMEMARSLPGGNSYWNMVTRRKIARFVYADEATRRGFTLARDGAREGWDAGSVEW